MPGGFPINVLVSDDQDVSVSMIVPKWALLSTRVTDDLWKRALLRSISVDYYELKQRST